MEELKSSVYFVAFLNALSKKDRELKELLRQLYYKAFEEYKDKVMEEEIDRAFEEWFEGIDRYYDNVLETVEVYDKVDEFKAILDKYVPQAEKVIRFIDKLTRGVEME
jgi:F0F1-type ATP synthase delta subunit